MPDQKMQIVIEPSKEDTLLIIRILHEKIEDLIRSPQGKMQIRIPITLTAQDVAEMIFSEWIREIEIG